MEKSSFHIPPNVKALHICDREGDMYELYEKASEENRLFVICIVQNKLTLSGEKIKASASIGGMESEKPTKKRSGAFRKSQDI